MKEKCPNIFIEDCVWDDEIFFTACERNAICKLKKNGRVEYITRYPFWDDDKIIFAGIYKYHNFLLLSPNNEKRNEDIVLYNLLNKSFEKIEIDSCYKKYLNFDSESIIEVKDYIYIFLRIPLILKIDMRVRKVKYIFIPDTKIGTDIIWRIFKSGKIGIIPLNNRNKVFFFDCENEMFRERELPCNITKIDTIAYKGNYIWVTGDINGIVEWNIEDNVCKVYNQFPSGFMTAEQNADYRKKNFYINAFLNDCLYLFPGFSNMIIKFNTITKKICEIDNFNNKRIVRKDKYYHYSDSLYGGVVKYKNDCILFFSFINGCINIINTKTQQIEVIIPEWDNYEEVLRDTYSNTNYKVYMIENWKYDLRHWMDYIIHK